MSLMGMFLLAGQAIAQQKTVTGKVTDEQLSPVSGASVVIRGTTIGEGAPACAGAFFPA